MNETPTYRRLKLMFVLVTIRTRVCTQDRQGEVHREHVELSRQCVYRWTSIAHNMQTLALYNVK